MSSPGFLLARGIFLLQELLIWIYRNAWGRWRDTLTFFALRGCVFFGAFSNQLVLRLCFLLSSGSWCSPAMVILDSWNLAMHSSWWFGVLTVFVAEDLGCLTRRYQESRKSKLQSLPSPILSCIPESLFPPRGSALECMQLGGHNVGTKGGMDQSALRSHFFSFPHHQHFTALARAFRH